MDVNIATEMKGAQQTVVTTTMEPEQADKPVIQPVPESSDAVTVDLNDQALHGRNARKEQQEENVSEEEIEEAVKEIQDRFETMGSHFKFGLYRHQEASTIVARLQDQESGDLIKQFPSEEVLELREKLEDLIGILFDKKV
ncbi:MAG: flagellar protein FlaG [Desulfobulbaceae bacterium]|nr:flagellar protein FlaG [Desulfobulbaceae bacterium]